MRRLWMLSLVVGSLTLLGGTRVSAQDATPVAASDRSEFVVPASECVINTLLPSDLFALTQPDDASPVAASPAAAPDIPFGAPDGEAADAETAAAVTAVFRQSWACLNAGSWTRFFSLLTIEEVRQNFAPEDIETFVSTTAVPLPEAEQTALYAVLDVEVLEDGRVGAYVIVDTVDDPLPVEVNYMIAVETDAGWKVDDFICFSGTGDLC